MGRLDVSEETGDLSSYTQVLDAWKHAAVSVCIFAACDVDGHLAAQSLTGLLRREGVVYSLVYVSGFSDLKRELNASATAIRASNGTRLIGVLLNCGAVVDLTRMTQISFDFQIFVFDSHRPIHQANLNCRHVFVVDKDANFAGNTENISSPSPKKRRLHVDEDADDERPEYVAEPTTLLMYELKEAVKAVSGVGVGELWNVAVAIASYRVLGKYTLQRYLTIAHAVDQQYIASLQNTEISFQSELNMPLFRHHSVHGSLGISSYVYGCLELHRDHGRRVLLQLLAYAGIPIDQSNQVFISMSLPVKLKLKNGKFLEACKQFNLGDIAMYDFVLNRKSEEISASDAALSLLTALSDKRIVETSDSDRRGLSIGWLRDVATQTKMILDRRTAKIKRKIRYVKIDKPATQVIAENVCVARLLGVFLATVFLHRPHGSTSDNHRKLPLLLAIRHNDRYRVVAVDIWASESLFYRSFKLAAIEAGTQLQSDYFDTEIAEVPVSDFDKWSNTLFAILGDDEDSEISASDVSERVSGNPLSASVEEVLPEF